MSNSAMNSFSFSRLILRLVFALVLFPVCSLADTDHYLKNSGWQKLSIADEPKMWVHSKHPRRMITMMKSVPSRRMDLSSATDIDLVSGISDMRKAILSKVGFTNWKLEFFNREHDAGVEQLILAGDYRTPGSETVQFVELHMFETHRFWQYTFSYDKSDANITMDSARAFLVALAAEDSR